MQKIFNTIIRLRYGVIALVLVITILFANQIRNLKINPDVVDYLPDDDPAAVAFKKIGKTFGGNFIGIIAVQSDNIFTHNSLTGLRKLTDTLKYVEGISFVTSLTNVTDIRNAGGFVEVSPLIDESEIPPDTALLQLRKYVLANDMYRGTLVSEDGTTALVIIRFEDRPDKMQIINRTKNIIEKEDPGSKIFIGGLPFMLDDLSRMISRDILFLAPLAFLLIAFILFLGFRKITGILFPLLTVLIAIIWTLGLMSWLGYEVTLITNVIPVILLAVGSAYCIHVINRIRNDMGKDFRKGLIKALVYIAVPVFFASLTTAFGFVSFIFGSYLTMIREFGIFMAAGVLFSLLLSLSFTPALLACFPSGFQTSYRPGKLSLLAEKTGLFTQKKYRIILIIWLLIVLAGISGIFKIDRKFDLAGYFHHNFPTRVTDRMLKEKFGGTLPVFVSVKGDIQSPDVLKKMKQVQEKLKADKGMSKVQSIVDVLEKMNDIMGEGLQLPVSKQKVQNLWFLIEGQDMISQMVTSNAKEALIQGMYNNEDPKKMKAFVKSMNDYISSVQNDKCSFELTGFTTIYEKLDRSLLQSQIKSLLIAILLVFLVLLWVLRSAKMALISALPIIITLMLMFGCMGWLNIPLDMATVLVGSISIGIGIDYAIHFISQFNNELSTGENFERAMEKTYRITGNSIVINVLSVSAGFVALLFSSLIPLQRFGILVIVTMLSSGIATLTFLPALLIFFKKNLSSNKLKS